MSRRARQRRKLLRSTIRSSRETPRALHGGDAHLRTYPRVHELLGGGGGLAWKAWLESTLRHAVGSAAVASAVALSASGALAASGVVASGCGTPAQASSPAAPVAVLAPLAPSVPAGAKPSEPVATLLPLPPPPPLPENMPPTPAGVPPRPHHPRPHVQHHMLGGAIAPPQVQPVALGGSPPAVDPNAVY